MLRDGKWTGFGSSESGVCRTVVIVLFSSSNWVL